MLMVRNLNYLYKVVGRKEKEGVVMVIKGELVYLRRKNTIDKVHSLLL